MARGELRSSARLAAVQALYQMDITSKGIGDVIAEFEAYWLGREIDGLEMKPAEGAFFEALWKVLFQSSAILIRRLMKRLPKAGL